MSAIPVRLVALLLAAPLAACSSGGGASAPDVAPDAQVSAEGDTPPRMVSSSRLEVPFTTVRVVDGRTPRAAARAMRDPWSLAVTVDAEGRPDLSTLVFTGIPHQDEQVTREAVTKWLLAARFEPARRNGVAVPGRFQRRFER